MFSTFILQLHCSGNVNIQCGQLCSGRLSYSINREKGTKTFLLLSQESEISKKKVKVKRQRAKRNLFDVAQIKICKSGCRRCNRHVRKYLHQIQFCAIMHFEKSTLTVCATEDTKPCYGGHPIILCKSYPWAFWFYDVFR